MNQAAQKELSRKEYWDERYINESNLNQPDEANYEWFKTFEQLRPFLQNHLPSPSSEPRILHCGCGTSVSLSTHSSEILRTNLTSIQSLTADLYAFGYTNQISIDFSEIAIEDMKQKYAALDQDWKVMDVRQMDIENAMIDIAIDKVSFLAVAHVITSITLTCTLGNTGRYAPWLFMGSRR